MTPRERITAALRREPVDRLPWTVDLAYYNTALRAQGRFPTEYEGVEGFLRQHEELGADPYLCYDAFWPWETSFDGIEQDSRQEGNDHIVTWALGGRTLVKVQRYLPESYCSAPVKWPVETAKEMEILLEILRRGRLTPRIERHRTLQESWGERGLLAIGVPRTPVPALLTEWCGITAATFLCVDEPELFKEVLRVIDGLHDAAYEALAEYAPVVVHFPDNLSGENVAYFWDAHMAPVYRRRIGQLHSAGTVCVIHNDGAVRPVLRRIAEAGFDGAEALTTAPVGDAEPGELRALAGREDFILWGMVPGALFTRTWSESKFRKYVQRVIESVEGPMILGTADQVPPDGVVERVRTAADVLAKLTRPSSG